MTTPALTTAPNNSGLSPAVKTILIAGLLTALLDATAAMVSAWLQSAVTPDRVWKYVATGVFGRSALTGGGGMVVAGLFFHFCVAFIFTTIFFFLYPRMKFLSRNIFITGIVWGLVVWAAMYFIVTPLSNVPPRKSFDLVRALPQLGIHMFIVGLPMALVIHRYYSGKRQVRLKR